MGEPIKESYISEALKESKSIFMEKYSKDGEESFDELVERLKCMIDKTSCLACDGSGLKYRLHDEDDFMCEHCEGTGEIDV